MEYRVGIRNQSFLNLTGDPNELLLPENIWTPESQTGSFITGNFEPANTYQANQNIYAGYVMNEQQVTNRFKAIYGARIEHFTHTYTGQNNLGNIVFNNQEIINEINVLPAVNLIYNITDDMNLRGSFSRTLARTIIQRKFHCSNL